MRISDWSSDVCSSDLSVRPLGSSQSLCWLLQLRFARASRLLQPQARSAHPRSYTAKPLASGYGCRCSPQIVRGNSAPFGEFCRKVRHGGTFGSSAGGLTDRSTRTRFVPPTTWQVKLAMLLAPLSRSVYIKVLGLMIRTKRHPKHPIGLLS